MFKFLRGRNKRQSDGSATNPDPSEVNTDVDQPEEPVNQLEAGLEEVLRSLFQTIKPTSPEEYAGIFKLLNKSQPLDVPILQQIMLTLDSSIDEDTAKSKAELLVRTLDDKNQGYIDVDQWVNWILQLPEDEITKLTKFTIIPEEMDEPTPHSRPGTEHQSTISDELLIDIAGKIGERDWAPLARELGFTKQEIRDVKTQFPHRSREQVYQVLVLWRQKLGQEATVAALEQVLSKSGMET